MQAGGVQCQFFVFSVCKEGAFNANFMPAQQTQKNSKKKNLSVCKEEAFNANFMRLAQDAKGVSARPESMIRGHPDENADGKGD